ncbi:MAG: NTP transferase domain-containing protein, partial [Acidobacteria bacterium]|nr:NTP transferase domain-containing protein [Acidobacteriota bacterium]
MGDLYVAVLAAGKGTRMRSSLPKVLHPAAGLPLIEHVLRTADTLAPRAVVIVVGHQAGQLQEALAKRLGLRFAVQEPQLGTGHALLQTEPALQGTRGTLLLLSGDVPLLRRETLHRLVRTH